MSQALLIRLIKAMFTLLIVAFLYVALVGTFQSPAGQGSASTAYSEVAPGQTQLQRKSGQRVWVTRVNPDLLTQLFTLNEWVAAGECELRLGFCVLVTDTARDGVYLRYSQTRPAVLASTVPWLGGFIDPTSGAVFDPLGRPYTSGVSAPPIKRVEQLFDN